MKPLLKKIQVMSSGEKKSPWLQEIPQENNFLGQHRELPVQPTQKIRQQFQPLRYSLLALMLAVPQIPLSGFSNHQKAVAQTSCPAGTISTPLNWTPATGVTEISGQTLTAGGIQATLNFSETIPGRVIDNQETRIDSSVYGGLAGPNLRLNIGPDKTPSPGSATLTINFSQPVTLASPLLLLDVDRDGQRDFNFTYQDRVTVNAFNNDSSVGVALQSLGTTTRVNGNLVVGINENSQPNAPDGNVQATIAGPVSRIQILYEAGQEYGPPRQDETIGLARINICAPGAGGSIGDTVYNDANNNSRQDNGETGIGNVNVTLTGAGTDGNFGTSDDITRNTTTDNGGRYSFGGLAPGNYRVSVNNNVAPVLGFSPTQVPANPITLAAGQNIDTADFGFVRQAEGSIGDTVYNDANANNTQDNGETGINGVTLNLIGAGPDGNFGTTDDVTRTTTTDNNGRYRFSNLIPGNYRVSTNAPSGFSPTQIQPDVININGQNIDTVDFGFTQQQVGSIGDTVFRDLNSNSVQDANEPGIADVTLTLRGSNGQVIRTTRTNNNGNYIFSNLQPGDYRVEPTNPGTLQLTTGNPSVSVPLQGGQNVTNADFGFNEARGSIGDTVFRDLNGNGVQDGVEPGISGVEVVLINAGPDGAFGTPDDVRRSQNTDNTNNVSDGRGRYTFNNLPPGRYRVEAAPPSRGVPGQPDLRAFLTTGINPIELELQPDQNITNADFGFNMTGFDSNRPGNIGDTVFNDRNGNGTQDEGEPGIPNVTLTLRRPGPDNQLGTPDDATETTTTNNNGIYGFSNLPSGDYRVTVTPPSGFLEQPTTGNRETQVNLQPGQSLLSVDFGFRQPGGSIGDTVFNDRNGNGIQDSGEPGIPNATLILRNPQGQEINRTTTNSNGIYGFNGLPLANYTVEALRPGTDFSPTTSTTLNANLTLPNQSLLNIDFGFRPPALGASETPDIIVIKRISNALRNGQPVSGVNFNTFVPDPNNNNDDALPQTERFRGVPNLEAPIQSGDQIEYTVYFLTQGTESLRNIRFCDLVPSGTTFANNSISLNGAGTGADGGRYLTPLAPLEEYTNICPGSNSNGAVVVNLGTIPGSNFGFVRFRVTVN
jgi:uncharacterized repeat protein (TIGR01451 family)